MEPSWKQMREKRGRRRGMVQVIAAIRLAAPEFGVPPSQVELLIRAVKQQTAQSLGLEIELDAEGG